MASNTVPCGANSIICVTIAVMSCSATGRPLDGGPAEPIGKEVDPVGLGRLWVLPPARVRRIEEAALGRTVPELGQVGVLRAIRDVGTLIVRPSCVRQAPEDRRHGAQDNLRWSVTEHAAGGTATAFTP